MIYGLCTSFCPIGQPRLWLAPNKRTFTPCFFAVRASGGALTTLGAPIVAVSSRLRNCPWLTAGPERHRRRTSHLTTEPGYMPACSGVPVVVLVDATTSLILDGHFPLHCMYRGYRRQPPTSRAPSSTFAKCAILEYDTLAPSIELLDYGLCHRLSSQPVEARPRQHSRGQVGE